MDRDKAYGPTRPGDYRRAQTAARRAHTGIFTDPIIIPPLSAPHSLTIVFLHDRASSATIFSEPLLMTEVPGHATFRQALPQAKFVFPAAPLNRAPKYDNALIHQWYDGMGDWEPGKLGDIGPNIKYLRTLLREETRLVGGDTGRIVLAGIGQGCAMALMSLMLWDGEPFGAMIGMCGFMPMCDNLTKTMEKSDKFLGQVPCQGLSGTANGTAVQEAIDDLRDAANLSMSPWISRLAVQSTPTFLGHGTVDQVVEIEHARKVAVLFGLMGNKPTFREYQGLGSRYSPAMLDHALSFITNKLKL